MKTLATTVMNGRIGVDFHGVINTDPTFFQKLISELLYRNIEVYIISGGPEEYIKKYMQKHQIGYSQIWCIYDYYHNKGQIKICDDGSFYMDDERWNKSKADYCRQNAIGMHIDDSGIYGKYFTTPYCYYNSSTRIGLLADRTIAFFGSPKLCANQLISVVDEFNNAVVASHHSKA